MVFDFCKDKCIISVALIADNVTLNEGVTIGNGCGETILAFFQTPQKKSAARGGIKRAQSTKNEAETGERKG